MTLQGVKGQAILTPPLFYRVRPGFVSENGAPSTPMKLFLVGWAKILNFKKGSNTMKTRTCRLEFGVNCLADIRFLYYAWDRLWSLEGGVPQSRSIMVYVTIEDRLPGDQVCLNFTASTEMLDRFMGILEQDGLKFTRNDLMPGFLIICRVDKDRGGLTVIGADDRHDSGSGTED
jgi:hypothetical protein